MTLPFRPTTQLLRSAHPPFKPLPIVQKTPDNGPPWFIHLRERLLTRPLPPLYGWLGASQALALETTLSTFLPPLENHRVDLSLPSPPHLPLGHHLVYFNHVLPQDELLPDGTDTVHSPGEPFSRRMWAGGSLKLNYPRAFSNKAGMTLDNRKWICQERIREVRQSGANSDNPKIFVDIERKFAAVNKGEFLKMDNSIVPNLSPEWTMATTIKGEERRTEAALLEERTLVFMKPRSAEELEAAKRGEGPEPKYLDPPGTPDFSHTLTPDEALLFRFSALTFNAHKIHLDPSYTLNVEGHRNLLVHGPLTLTLMLTLLHDHLRATSPSESLLTISYRNLAPLYCNEPMRICGRKRASGPMFLHDVWIEGPTGGVAVKGTCRTQAVDDSIRLPIRMLRSPPTEPRYVRRLGPEPDSGSPFYYKKVELGRGTDQTGEK